MKKFFVVTSVLLMCCMFMGCGVKAKLDGTWKANKSESYQSQLWAIIETPYTSLDTKVPVVITSERNITLTINKDGNFSQEIVSTQTTVVEESFYEGYPEGTKITVYSDDGKTYYKMSGNWYYDNDKIILKTTHYELQQDGDDEKETSDDITCQSEEVYLIDDILFATYYGEIYEFTKAE